MAAEFTSSGCDVEGVELRSVIDQRRVSIARVQIAVSSGVIDP
jgi:hypothetical protein